MNVPAAARAVRVFTVEFLVLVFIVRSPFSKDSFGQAKAGL